VFTVEESTLLGRMLRYLFWGGMLLVTGIVVWLLLS